MKHLFCLLFVGLFCLSGFSQDKLFMMNGSTSLGKIVSIGTDTIKFIPAGKTKTIDLDKYRVFSIQYEEGKRQILYVQDTTKGHDYTVKEMELIVMGGQDALNNHKTLFPFALATGLGGVGGYALSGSFLVFGVPMVSMVATSLIAQPIINRSAVRKAILLKDKHYKKGYRRVLRVKRNNQAVWGSIFGTIGGAVIYAVSSK